MTSLKYKITIHSFQRQTKKNVGQSKSDTPRSKANKQMENINLTLFETIWNCRESFEKKKRYTIHYVTISNEFELQSVYFKTRRLERAFWHYLKLQRKRWHRRTKIIHSDTFWNDLKTKHVKMCILTLVETITNCRET